MDGYHSPVADAFGGFLIGVFISLIMYGIIISQCLTYYEQYQKDPLWLKAFVASILLLDTASSWFAVQWMYEMWVLNWGNINAFVAGNWLLALDPILAGILAFMVQVFFAWRIKVITYNKWLAGLIVFLGLLNVLGAIGTAIAVLWVKDYARFAEFRPIAVIWLVSSAVADLSITAVLSYHLRSRRTGFEKTTRLLNSIVRLTVQNGLLTSLTALMDIILYLTFAKPYHITLSFIIPKLYCNTVLSSLNARQVGREKEWTTGVDVSEIVIASGRPSRRTNDVVTLGTTLGPGNTSNLGSDTSRVYVDVETHEMTDPTKSDEDWATKRVAAHGVMPLTEDV